MLALFSSQFRGLKVSAVRALMLCAFSGICFGQSAVARTTPVIGAVGLSQTCTNQVLAAINTTGTAGNCVTITSAYVDSSVGTSAANLVWLFKPTSGSGTAYAGTPTLLNGGAISSSFLTTPVNGQLMIFIPDVVNTGAVTFTIDGSVARSARYITGGGSTQQTFAANDLGNVANQGFLFEWKSPRWFAVSPIGSLIADEVTISAGAAPFQPQLTIKNLGTATNCSDNGSPAACGSAGSGAVAIPTGITSVALTVNTTAVTNNSRIFLFSDDSLTVPSTTCNSTLATLTGGMSITARSVGTSFTVTYNGTIATNPLCVSYIIVN